MPTGLGGKNSRLEQPLGRMFLFQTILDDFDVDASFAAFACPFLLDLHGSPLPCSRVETNIFHQTSILKGHSLLNDG